VLGTRAQSIGKFPVRAPPGCNRLLEVTPTETRVARANRRAAWANVHSGCEKEMTLKSRAPLRGRDAELARVASRFDEVASGVGAVVVVEGRAGMGKTRLLEECSALARHMSFRVGHGMAEPGRSVVELGALLNALFGGDEPLLDRTSLRGLPASSEQVFWLLQDVEALIEEAAINDRLLICLDDLQWGGPRCAIAMRQLPYRLASLPVAWIMAFRPNQGLQQIVDAKNGLLDAGAEFISLGPLDRDAVSRLAEDILGAVPDDELLERAQRVHGSPFLLVEFFRGLQDEGLVATKYGRATLLADRVPHRVSDSVHARLSRMSPLAERVATLAASLGRRFMVRDLADMAGLPVTDLVEPIRELMDADIFIDSGDRLAFGHDLIREGAAASSPSAVRRALDRQAVDVLLARGALPKEVAHQLAASADAGDTAAIAILLEAADDLGVTDPAMAAELAAMALNLAPVGHPLRGPLVARRVVALFAAGSGEEGKRFADSALRQSLSADEEARVRLSVSSMFDVSPKIRAESARAALALPALSTDLRASLWASLFHNLVVGGRLEEALAVEPKSREAIYAGAVEASRSAFELPESAVYYQLSDFGRALEILTAAEQRGFDSHDDPRKRLAHNFRAWILAALDRYSEAIEAADDGVAAAHRDRQNWALRVFETTRGRQLLQMGQLAEAMTALEGRFGPNEAHLVVSPLDAPSVVALGKLRMHTGDERGVTEVASVAKIMLRSEVTSVKHHAIWLLALLALSKGNPVQAHQWLLASGNAERLAVFPLFPVEAVDDPQLVRIATAVGDQELAERVIGQAERRLDLNPGVTTFAAVVAHARGIWYRSITELQTAVDLFSAGPRPLAYASALEDLAGQLVRGGQRDDGVAAFDQALSITSRVGADWDTGRLRGRLRQLGIRRRTTSAERPRTGWASLTDAELAVARLATEGNTNRQIAEKLFISPHTVNTHLRHIFEKLGINSRVTLTRVSERRDIGGPEMGLQV
jgi:DNA-binding CsgD family transcriptional regulator